MFGKMSGEATSTHDTLWVRGVWLGRVTHTNEHVIGTATGVVRESTVKRVNEEERYTSQDFEAMVWTPWKPDSRSQDRERTFVDTSRSGHLRVVSCYAKKRKNQREESGDHTNTKLLVNSENSSRNQRNPRDTNERGTPP